MILKDNEKQQFNNSPVTVDSRLSLQRTDHAYENLSEKFKLTVKDFTKQFAHIYAERLLSLRDCITNYARDKWGENTQFHILSDLADKEGSRCVVIGTIFKYQEFKPSFLKEISEENQLNPQPPRQHFTSTSDLLILEDETQRIKIQGALKVSSLVTGVVVALLGTKNKDGAFVVEDHCFSGASLTKPLRTPPTNDCYVALVSGLQLGSCHDLMSLHLLCDWLCGDGGGTADSSKAAQTCRLILVGNCIGHLPATDIPSVGKLSESAVLDGVKMLDNVCFELAQSIPVDVMPGEHDPSNHSLPQQPLHPCMLPSATSMQTCNLVSNPYQFAVGGRQFLGTSGQPISNLGQITDDLDPLALLQSTLEWGHLAPSAPETLACYPYSQKDPFIIEEMPDVYFAGNQKEFQTKIDTSSPDNPVRLLCIPSFSLSKICVLVNLRNLDCVPIHFNVA